jgi:hypothetical protein
VPSAVVLFSYVFLAIIFTWPLILHLNTHVLGHPADNFEYVWKMWWVPHAIFERGISPFWQPDVYYPFGFPMANGELTPIHTFFLAPLTLLLGDVMTYNLAGLASGVLSGWFMYHLACGWMERLEPEHPSLLHLGAFFAGAAYAFCAYRFTHLSAQLPLVGTHWLVLAIFGLDRWVGSRRAGDAVLAAVGIAFASLSSWYYAYMLLLLGPVYLVARADNLITLIADRRSWLAAGLVVVIVGALCGPFLLPYLRLYAEGSTSVPLWDASFWAASPSDYLLPNPHHPLWGEKILYVIWPTSGDWRFEFAVSIGWITLLFSLWGWGRLRGAHWRAMKWVTVAAFVLSLGPYLHLGRIPSKVPLPVLGIRAVLPGADSIRTWGRFSIFVMFGMSVLAGAGLMLWSEQHEAQRTRLAVAAVALGLMLFEAWPGTQPISAVGPRAVDTWLASQPGNEAIMQYPLDEALSGPAMLYTRYHGKPVVFGYGTYLPFVYRDRHPELLTFPGDPALDLLQAWNVRYILVNTEGLGDEDYTLADIDAQPRLRNVTTIEGQAVYDLIE